METLEKTDRCPDCQAAVGEKHTEGCDWATCLWDGDQRLMCELTDPDELESDHDCGEDRWTGYTPGAVEMAEVGLWIRWVDGRGWVAARPGEQGAMPDLNKLHDFYRWDRENARWARR